MTGSKGNQTDGVGSRMTHYRLWRHRLRVKLDCQSRKQKRKNRPITTFDPGLVIGRPFRLRWSSFHRIISEGVVNGIRRNGSILILPTMILSSLNSAYDSNFRFSHGPEGCHDSEYNSDQDYDTIASENRPRNLSYSCIKKKLRENCIPTSPWYKTRT